MTRWNLTPRFGAVLGMLHYFKRELESHFVHIFGNASVPVSGSVKNIIHYWFVYGILSVGEVFFFKAPAGDWPKKYYYGMTALWAICEFMNYRCHMTLRNLRVDSEGNIKRGVRGIPKGNGFDTVHCANYLWEIMGWTIYTIMTKSWMSALFTASGAAIMAVWAQGKKKALLEYFKDDEEVYKRLKKKPAIFPFLY